jgi:NADPH-dependent 2,4-dienoyl-CoA reductase/sulfur reductase-like enzyme
MTPYDYLIVGGGMVADAAARGIRERDADATIAIVGEEPTVPFPRPALSKRLWTDPGFSFDEAALHTEKHTGATLLLGRRVVSLDVDAHTVGTDDGGSYAYRRLLLATGGHPRRIPGLDPGERVLYFRTLRDYERLRDRASSRPHVVVVGGGYIGSELAAALVQHECRVTLVHADHLLGARMFPTTLARTFQALFVDAGVDVRGGLEVTGGRQRADGVTLELSDGSTLEADAAVVGIGIEPSAEPTADGLTRADDGGIVVDERLATSLADVWAAGDVAEYPDRILGRRRVEHVDNADRMGAAAGRIMAGSDETYDHTPMLYSDVLGHGYEAVGTLDAGLEVVQDPHDDGLVVYYLDDTEVRGVLLWDCHGGLEAARDLLARHDRPADPSDLIGAVRA